MKLRFLFLTATVISAPVLAPANSRAFASEDAAPAASSSQFYDTRIKSILSSRCYKCHTDRMSGGLRVDSREELLTGGDSGPAIVPGDREKSLLIEAVCQRGDVKMPKGGGRSDEEIADLEAWVKAGSVWSEMQKAQAAEGATPSSPVAPNLVSAQNAGSND